MDSIIGFEFGRAGSLAFCFGAARLIFAVGLCAAIFCYAVLRKRIFAAIPHAEVSGEVGVGESFWEEFLRVYLEVFLGGFVREFFCKRVFWRFFLGRFGQDYCVILDWGTVLKQIPCSFASRGIFYIRKMFEAGLHIFLI